MLMQNDPFREVDALFNRLAKTSAVAMPMDAYRRGNDVWLHVELPGVSAESLDISVERGVLTLTAERSWQRQDGDRVYFAERQPGTLRRQIRLGEGLDLEHIEADLHDGVLTLRVPVAEKAQPKRIEIKPKTAAIDAASIAN